MCVHLAEGWALGESSINKNCRQGFHWFVCFLFVEDADSAPKASQCLRGRAWSDHQVCPITQTWLLTLHCAPQIWGCSACTSLHSSYLLRVRFLNELNTDVLLVYIKGMESHIDGVQVDSSRDFYKKNVKSSAIEDD